MAEEIFVRKASGLVRELEWYDIAIWALAAPAGSGITYYSVKLLGNNPGGDVVVAFLLAGLLWAPLVMLMAILSASFPRSSSLYVLTSRTIHPILGYLSFWMFIIGGGAALACGLLAFISIKAFAGSWVAAGYISKSATMLSIGNALTNPINQLMIAIAIIIATWAFNLVGMRFFKWVMRVIVILPLVTTILVIIGMAISGPGSGTVAWDKYFGGTVADITRLAIEGSAAGISISTPIKPQPFWTATYGMFNWVLWAYTGFEVVTFVGSEVKSPRKSYFRGYLYGMVAVMVLYIATSLLIKWVLPLDFLESYSFLQMNNRAELEALMGGPAPDPSIPFFASILIGNPTISIVVGVAYFLWVINTLMAIWIAGVRGVFSLAFDRSLPEIFARVSPKGNPTWANHLIAVVAIIGALISLGDSYGFEFATSIVAYNDFSCLFFVWPVGLSAMLLPYWRKDLFEQTVIQTRIAGVPIITILGAITFAVGWFFMIITAYTSPLIVLVNVGVALIGVVVFVYQTAKNEKKGIDVKKIYNEIPPA